MSFSGSDWRDKFLEVSPSSSSSIHCSGSTFGFMFEDSLESVPDGPSLSAALEPGVFLSRRDTDSSLSFLRDCRLPRCSHMSAHTAGGCFSTNPSKGCAANPEIGTSSLSHV